MQLLGRLLLRRNIVLSSTTFTAARPLSVLSSVAWNKFDHGQLMQLSPALQNQQIRFRRHDRASAFTKPRPKTKKQRQEYNRRQKKIADEEAKHNPPGFRAGPRRQFIRERWQYLLDQASGKEVATIGDNNDDEYGIEDALVEDLLGNTAHLTSQPTPEPTYLGHRHQEYYDIVQKRMDLYRHALDAQAQSSVRDSESKGEVLHLATGAAHLPSDASISKVLRAFRDRNGTRNRPIGIAAALEHILKDLGVPIVAFGELTYTTLLTCCRTPVEARRIMKLMTDQQHPISAYSWSILVDIHAKLGDYEGCARIIKEMASEGTPPTQAAYTSLMASCYKVCNDGRIPHAIRAKAGEIGWSHWQEMRIVGIQADAMAYGAIIRLCGARGQAERAINLLEEMYRFDVKPTSLCFSSALRAVARSHEIGVRFEKGSSRKQLRRELFAAHHGKMARQIVIMAENAQIEQDESFVSALMLCAAAAGDSATAKAVYLAAEVRKMDHLRTIGPDSSLNFLRGDVLRIPHGSHAEQLEQRSESSSIHDSNGNMINMQAGRVDDTSIALMSEVVHLQGLHEESVTYPIKSFGEREYGKDTRALSALLRSCGQAMDPNGLGTMWAGRSNQGYLCENSLRLITTRWEPSYSKTSIPDELSTKVGISSLRRFDENDRDEPRKKGATRKNFRGLYLNDDGVELIDDYSTVYGTSHNPAESDDIHEFTRALDISSEQISGDAHIPTGGSNGADDSATAQDQDDFAVFFEELKREALAYGLDEEPSEEDARELFEALQEEFATGEGIDEDEEDLDQQGTSQTFHAENPDSISYTHSDLAPIDENNSAEKESRLALLNDHIELSRLKPDDIAKIRDLQRALPGLPISRLRKVTKAFESTLGYPSILTLVPILRESLPDHLTSGRLKRMNTSNANFVLQKAEEYRVVDISLLNSMLQVKTSASSLDDAESFHRDEFRRHNLKPTTYSDRLVLQMFVENNRLQRALDFKRTIEQDKRRIDIPSYGSLIEYYSKHHQLGSAMILLKECVAVHGSPPSEKYLNGTRVLARQLQMESKLRLNELIGNDPIEWLKYGERFMKREKSKKGRRNVQLAYNRILG